MTGNLIQEQRFIQERAEARRYAYDAYNRNTEVRGKDFLHKNFYDAEGIRNRIEENGKATDFVYSGDMLFSEKDVNSTRECRYILGNEYLGHESVREEPSDTNACQKQAYSYLTLLSPSQMDKTVRKEINKLVDYVQKKLKL